MEIARSIEGLDIEAFEKSVESAEQQQEVIKDNQLVADYQVQLTPTIMVGDTALEDPFDYEKIKSLIDAQLEGK